MFRIYSLLMVILATTYQQRSAFAIGPKLADQLKDVRIGPRKEAQPSLWDYAHEATISCADPDLSWERILRRFESLAKKYPKIPNLDQV